MRRLCLFLAFAAAIGVTSGVAVGRTAAQAVVQSYTYGSGVQRGMVVQVDTNDAHKIVPATDKHADKALGVVVAPNDAPLSVSGSESARQAYVADTGSYRTLVSDQNGAIAKGDYVTVSSLDGVAMRADDSQAIVIGKALSSFTSQDDTNGSTTIRDSGGQTRTIRFGYVTLAIGVAHNPRLKNTTADVPNFLQKASESVANKPVSFTRVYLSLAVLLFTTVIVGSILYAGVRTSLVSVGRNPLARSSIMRNLLQVVLTSLIILVAGLFAVYLVVKL